jgi:hypothetical protein
MRFLKLLIHWFSKLTHKQATKIKFPLTILTNLILKMRKLIKLLTMEGEQQKKFLRVLNQLQQLVNKKLL